MLLRMYYLRSTSLLRTIFIMGYQMEILRWALTTTLYDLSTGIARKNKSYLIVSGNSMTMILVTISYGKLLLALPHTSVN